MGRLHICIAGYPFIRVYTDYEDDLPLFRFSRIPGGMEFLRKGTWTQSSGNIRYFHLNLLSLYI